VTVTAPNTFSSKSIRGLCGVCAQVVSYVLSGAVFIAGFFGAALVLDAPFTLLAVSVFAAITIGLLGSYLAALVFKLKSPFRYTFVQGLLPVALFIGLTAVFILRPIIANTQQNPLIQTSGVEYWQLPTGSTVAVQKVAAQGSKDLNPIVFLHGGPGAYSVSLGSTVDVISQLTSDSHDVYFYDQIGGGLSQRLNDISQYSFDRHIRDLEAVFQKIGADEIILIGSSWGSSLGASYMAKHPSHVSHAIFSGPSPIFHPDWKDVGDGGVDEKMTPTQKKAFSTMVEKPRLFVAIALAEINPIAAARFAPDSELGALFDQAANKFYLPFSVCDEKMLEVQSSRYGFWSNRMTGKTLWNRKDDPKPQLMKNETPVLIMRGKCDYKKEAVAKQYASIFPNATYVVLEDAGHMPYWEKPKVYLQTIRDFLSRYPTQIN